MTKVGVIDPTAGDPDIDQVAIGQSNCRSNAGRQCLRPCLFPGAAPVPAKLCYHAITMDLSPVR